APMPFILIGAFIGFLFARLHGLIIGAALGYALSWYVQNKVIGSLRVLQSQLLETTFSIMGALCKADRVVTRDEIKTAENVFDRLHLSGEQREAAKAAFNRGKASGFDVDAAADAFAQVARGRAPLIQLFLQVQLMAVAADGNVHPAEHEMLVRVARRLGLTERDVMQLEALLRATSAGPSAAGSSPPRQRLDDAYAALGLSPNASAVEIKRAYRRLMSRNHPDKLASRGLPESMREIAEERSREINAAYDLIKEARQFT
ncbi:MAG TPA: co-chaperone DjlA, partial [Woeseiaceae bacterium]|nr:co-chaperone DjlA [Woeseiaceae bacterium]